MSSAVHGRVETVGVYVIDDHPVVAQGIALMLDGTDDLRFAGSAPSLDGALPELRQLRPAVILLDGCPARTS